MMNCPDCNATMVWLDDDDSKGFACPNCGTYLDELYNMDLEDIDGEPET